MDDLKAQPFVFSLVPRPSSLVPLFLHLLITLPLAWTLNLWLDEAWTMQTTAHGVVAAWGEALAVERQAPLYFVLLAAWRAFDDSLFFARLFSVVCTAVTVALIPALTRRFLPEAGSFLKTALIFVVALHPYTIWAALEARGYALVILLTALLLLTWFDGYFVGRNRRGQFIYVLLALAALYTNYYLGFMLFANACALLAARRWRALGNYVWQMIVLGACFLPLISIVGQQSAANADYYRAPVTLRLALRTVWDLIAHFALPTSGSGLLNFVQVWTMRFAALALLALWLRNARRRVPDGLVQLLVIVAVISAFLVATVFGVGHLFVQLRHAAVLFVPAMLLTASLIHWLAPKIGGTLWLALLIVFSTVSLWTTYSPLVKEGDAERIARFLMANETAGQPILSFYVYDRIALGYYYSGKNQLVPETVAHDWNLEAEEGTINARGRQIEFLRSSIPPEHHELWLTTNRLCETAEYETECRPLEDFVQQHYVIVRSENFHRRRVRLLRRRASQGETGK